MGNLHPQNEQDTSAPRLGFHEIVPGSDRGKSQDQNSDICIPEFDVSRQLMVDERRESAARRQGPGRTRDSVQEEVPPKPVEQAPREVVVAVSGRAAQAPVSAYRHPVIQRHAIVADIVRRDIQRLCMASLTA